MQVPRFGTLCQLCLGTEYDELIGTNPDFPGPRKPKGTRKSKGNQRGQSYSLTGPRGLGRAVASWDRSSGLETSLSELARLRH
jgi:hypothetical protein